MPIDDLFAEAQRQLAVCNSCRYCQGYCPVWPALELRTALSAGDLTHLSNLCHDCRECYSACMYTAPHEFDLNPPKVFAAVRGETYRDYVRPRPPGWMSGRRGVAATFAAAVVLLVSLALLTGGGAALAGPTSGSAYDLVPHLMLVAVVTLPAVWSCGVLAVAGLRYWRDTHGRSADLLDGLLDGRAWWAGLGQAANLRHMTGGGAGCDEPEPGRWRRRLHLAVSYGFLLCLLSTASAAVMQEFLGLMPPYDPLTVPVVTGTLGGAGIAVGCAGLLLLKRRSDPEQGTAGMRAADYSLLWALLVLAVTGLATLFLRHTALFGIVLLVHLAAVVVAFAVAPYTKFVHVVFRLLAIYKDNLDRRVTALPVR